MKRVFLASLPLAASILVGVWMRAGSDQSTVAMASDSNLLPTSEISTDWAALSPAPTATGAFIVSPNFDNSVPIDWA